MLYLVIPERLKRTLKQYNYLIGLHFERVKDLYESEVTSYLVLKYILSSCFTKRMSLVLLVMNSYVIYSVDIDILVFVYAYTDFAALLLSYQFLLRLFS